MHWFSAGLSFLFPGLGQARGGRLASAVVIAVAFSSTFWICRELLPWMPAGKSTLAFLVGMELLYRLLVAAHAARLTAGPEPLPATAAWLVVAVSMAVVQRIPAVEEHSPARAFSIPSGSMIPTLEVGDFLTVDSRSHSPQRDEVVIFRRGKTYYVKRVVGVAGDRIAVASGRLVVDGKPEPPRFGNTEGTFAETTVPVGTFFVMGDNRNNSEDSRYVGPIPLADYVGKARWIIWSEDWSRVGRSL